jgi:hypothetical protein
MNDQLPHGTRQQRLTGVTNLLKVTATARDQALGRRHRPATLHRHEVRDDPSV